MTPHRGPTDAFEALGHPIRVDILAAVAEAQREEDVSYPTGFAELRRLADVDVSSQFNYHLDRLRGRFLRKDACGYRLTYAGWEITRAMTSGVFADVEVGPVDTTGRCPLCGTRALTGAFRDDWAVVACNRCERDLVRYTFPPFAARERDPESFLDGLDARLRAHADLARRGVCAECGGEMRPATQVSDPEWLSNAKTGFICKLCGNKLYHGVGFSLIGCPAVAAVLRDRGISLRARRCWEFSFFVSEDAVTVRNTSPWHGVVTMSEDEDRVTVHLDDTFDVQYAAVR